MPLKKWNSKSKRKFLLLKFKTRKPKKAKINKDKNKNFNRINKNDEQMNLKRRIQIYNLIFYINLMAKSRSWWIK